MSDQGFFQENKYYRDEKAFFQDVRQKSYALRSFLGWTHHRFATIGVHV